MLGMPAQHSGLRNRWPSWRLSGRRRLPLLHRYCHLHNILRLRYKHGSEVATHSGTVSSHLYKAGPCMTDLPIARSSHSSCIKPAESCNVTARRHWLQMQCTPCAQAEQAAAIHARQAQQARAELEEVRRRAADSIRASSASTAQLRELGELRARLLDAESSTAGSAHDLQAWHLISAWQSPCLLTLSPTVTRTCSNSIHLQKPTQR